jgi:hypothetical protein
MSISHCRGRPEIMADHRAATTCTSAWPQWWGKKQVPDASSATQVLQPAGGSLGTAVLTLAFSHTFWWSLGFTALAVLPALLRQAAHPQPIQPRHKPKATTKGER